MEPAAFDLSVRQPDDWLESGAELLRAARAIIRQIQVDRAWDDQERANHPRRREDPPFTHLERAVLLRPALLLSALGAEVGLKAVAVCDLWPVPMPPEGKLPRSLETHDLSRLARAVGLAVTDRVEQEAVAEGRRLIEWGARYPLPLRNAPELRIFDLRHARAYERIFLRCAEVVAIKLDARRTDAQLPLQPEVVSERIDHYDQQLGGISGPVSGEEAFVARRLQRRTS